MRGKKPKEQKENNQFMQKEWGIFFNGMVQPAIILDPQHGIIAANKASLDAIGKTEEEILGTRCFELFHGTDRPPEGCPFEKIISTGHAETIEMEMETLHGTFLVSCTPVYDNSGRLQRIIHVATDITERKKAERALQESEERYRVAIENSNDCVAMVKEGKYIYVNKIFLETFELKDGNEILNKPFGSFVHPDDRERMISYNTMRNRGEPAPSRYEFRAVRKDGGIVYFEASIAMITYKGEKVALAYLRDVTERKTAEQALRDSEGKYRSIFENAVEGIFQSTPEGRFVSVNPAMARMCRYSSPEEMIFAIADIGGQHYVRPEEREEYKRLMEGQGVVENFEHEIYRKDGTTLWVSTSSRAIRDEKGRIIRYEGTHEDITSRKTIEEELKKNEAMLQGILRAATIGVGLLINRVFVWVNNYVTAMTGYSKEDLIGKSARILYADNEEFTRVGTEKYAEIRGKGKGSIETRWRKKDGTVIDIFLSSAAIDPSDLSVGVVFTALDITSGKHAEQALRASEERFRELADLLPQTVFETDRQGNFTYVNRHSFDQFGYTEEDVAKGMNAVGMVVPEERLRAMQDIGIIMKGEMVTGKEYTGLRKNGETFSMYVYSAPIVKEGQPTGLRGIAVDITERKTAEEALKESEERYRTAMENSNDGIAIVKGDTHLYVNKRFVQIFGYDRPEDIIGKPVEIVVHPDDVSMVTEMSRNRIKGEEVPSNYGFKGIKKTGEIVYIEVSATTMMYRGETVNIIFLRDITRRKVAEEALIVSEARYRVIFENTGTATMIVEDDTTISLVNTEFERLWGYSKAEIEGKKSWMEFAHRDDLERMKEYHRLRRIEPDAAPRSYEFLFVNRKSDVRNVFITSAMIPETKRHVASLIDITERKHAEDAKIRLEMQLLQAQKMEAIGQLAGGIAHDFNNILTTIIGYSDLLRIKMDVGDPTRIYVEQILASAQKAAQLTHSLLAFSRKQVIELKPHNVNDIIHAVQKILARLLTEDIELKTDLADADLMVLVDETQLDQVLMNLATNARDSMPDGGRLYIKSRQFVMDDGFVKRNAFGKEGTYALISVSDTGIGIDKGMIDKIFEPFFTTKEVGKGTGLGLAIVYGIIKQHNGHINVYSEPGKGTTFNIYIPLVRIKSERPAVMVKEDIKGGNETILLAEDNADVRILTKMVLESKGYTVIEAIDGEAAINTFEENKDRIGMVILDVVMPKKNGKEVNEAIQKIKLGTHVLFISGYTADIVFDKGVKNIGINYISKPLLPDELLKKVRAVIDKT
ncbi:MAG: PAS domain S-box protein [Proteobacteria bacterium]|nr:PAS domain S-box protein [Pseudomonadota bacterium]